MVKLPKIETKERVPVMFAMQVDPLDSGTLDYLVRDPCTIDGLRIRFYQGAFNDLRLQVYMQRADDVVVDLVRMVGKQYLDGNDDLWEFDIVTPAPRLSRVVVGYENTDPNEALDFKLVVTLDYLKGIERTPVVVRQDA